jgi:hypothetical protein
LRSIIAFIIILFFASFYAAAQQTVIKGVVYKSLSSERISEVFITNLRTKGVAISDARGNFSIDAGITDTLQFIKKGFTPQQQQVSSYGMVVYMQPVVQLAEVQIYGQTKKQELSGILNDYRSKGLYFDGKPPATIFLPFGGSPLTGLHELFSKDARNMRRFAAFTKNELEATEVDKRYNKPFVTKAIGLTENDSTTVIKFMEYYRPSFDQLKAWGDYDLIKSIRKEYEYFKKNGDHPTLQKLY